MTMMHQCRFIFGKICVILLSDIDNEGGYSYVGWVKEGISVSSPQFCFEPETGLKI